ncbi:hypothetical protein Zm00014a_013806 [Zea mays]|uniref:Uncharacterized protein n=1 Tax=Zea mays TaxID=4577 RepID=A0A3L6EFA2_MAIZE|nr:hypothetical protein Zm00014a_013806 [Zea mays]
MEGILERYQRYSFEERVVLDPTIVDQNQLMFNSISELQKKVSYNIGSLVPRSLCREEDANCDNTRTVEQQQPSDDRQTVEHAPLQETDPGKETHVLEAKTLTADADGNLSSSQQTGEYNELLRQYY